jgi:hypothetical protein
MKTIYAVFELLFGAFLGVLGIIQKDIGLLIIGCMIIICGKLDFINFDKSNKL